MRMCRRHRSTFARDLLCRDEVAGAERCRARLFERRVHLRQRQPARRIAMWDPEQRRLLTGHATQHRTRSARMWRLRLRLKQLVQRQQPPVECDHDWVFVDESFDHDLGTETVHYWRCSECDATRGMEPGDCDDDDWSIG
jgi:hypothetical protein